MAFQVLCSMRFGNAKFEVADSRKMVGPVLTGRNRRTRQLGLDSTEWTPRTQVSDNSCCLVGATLCRLACHMRHAFAAPSLMLLQGLDSIEFDCTCARAWLLSKCNACQARSGSQCEHLCLVHSTGGVLQSASQTLWMRSDQSDTKTNDEHAARTKSMIITVRKLHSLVRSLEWAAARMYHLGAHASRNTSSDLSKHG